MFLYKLLLAILSIYLFFSFHCLNEHLRNRKEERLRSSVRHCINAHPSQYIPTNFPSNPYAITKDEYHYAYDIILAFQSDLAKRCVNGQLERIRSKSESEIYDYDLFWLYCFLKAHVCDDKFLEYEMHADLLTSNGRWDSIGDSTYSLTDFALVFLKLYYFAFQCCKDSERINPSKLRYSDEESQNIRKNIDTRQIAIYRYN